MTETQWFISRSKSNGQPDVTTYDTNPESDREREACRNLLDTLEMGSRAAKAAR